MIASKAGTISKMSMQKKAFWISAHIIYDGITNLNSIQPNNWFFKITNTHTQKCNKNIQKLYCDFLRIFWKILRIDTHKNQSFFPLILINSKPWLSMVIDAALINEFKFKKCELRN